MAEGMYGPFDSNAFGEFLTGLVDRKEQTEQSMESRLRVFVESMTDDTLENLGWLMARIAEQPELSHAMRGVLTAEYWRRNPIQVPEDGSSEE